MGILRLLYYKREEGHMLNIPVIKCIKIASFGALLPFIVNIPYRPTSGIAVAFLTYIAAGRRKRFYEESVRRNK